MATHVSPAPQGSHDARTDVTWDMAYRRYRGLLLGALARLAARGHGIPPDEGLDVIHDFFMLAWDRVGETYDPSRAKFETYLFAYFVNFARPRIARLNRMRTRLVGPDEAAAIVHADLVVDPREADTGDLPVIRLAMAGLREPERLILVDYLGDPGVSERALALKFGLSRHGVRTHLADALGQMAVTVGGSWSLPEPDHSVILTLYRGEWDVRQTAERLHLPVARVQAARLGMYKRLARAIKGERKLNAMTHERTADGRTAADLVAAALSTDDPSTLDAIRETREAVLAFLEGPQAETVIGSFLADGGEAVERRMVDLYEALADETFEEASSGDAHGFAAMARDADAELGDAFGRVLLAALPPRLADLAAAFAGLPPAEEEVVRHLRREPSMWHAGAAATALPEVGLTPLGIAEIVRTVADNLEEHCRSHGLDVGATLYLPDAVVRPTASVVDRALLLDDVVEVSGLPRETCDRTLRWLLEVGSHVPLLFEGFTARRGDGGLRLDWTDVPASDPVARWRGGDA